MVEERNSRLDDRLLMVLQQQRRAESKIEILILIARN